MASARPILQFQASCEVGQALTTLTKKTSHRIVAENLEQQVRGCLVENGKEVSSSTVDGSKGSRKVYNPGRAVEVV